MIIIKLRPCQDSHYTVYAHIILLLLYYIQRNLEGIKDALCYKFRRTTIGQNCSAMCTNKGGHRDTFLNKQHKVPCVSRSLHSRPPSLEQSERQGLFFVTGRFDVRVERERLLLECSGDFRFIYRVSLSPQRSTLSVLGNLIINMIHRIEKFEQSANRAGLCPLRPALNPPLLECRYCSSKFKQLLHC